jgi:hypothetical protein
MIAQQDRWTMIASLYTYADNRNRLCKMTMSSCQVFTVHFPSRDAQKLKGKADCSTHSRGCIETDFSDALF